MKRGRCIIRYFDYKENKQHGTFDFPIEHYHVTPTHPRYTMPYHWHNECELIRVLEGEFLLVIDNEKILAKKDDIVFIHDGMFHGGSPINCIYECIVFDMKLLLKQNHACTKKIQDIINQNKIIKPLLTSSDKSLKTCCDELFESIKHKHTGYEFLTQGCLYYFLGLILRDNLYSIKIKDTKRSEERITHFKTVLSLIENEYHNALTLDDLSRSCGMNSKYFCKFFYEMTNKTPIEYLNYYRIESACEKLLTTDQSITEISLSCGFNDVSYFIRTFKKFKEVTPKKFVKNRGSKS